MGLFDKVGNFLGSDTVKNGVREMMIARPPDNGDLVWKHPDRTIPMFAQVTVNADDWAVFTKEGRPVGTLDAGRTTLSTQNIPFLSNFIDQYTGGNLFTTDLFFVKRTPFPRKFGGTLGNMIDPMTNIRLRARCHGELLLRVENPEALIYQYFGMRTFQDHPDIFDWFINAFFNTLKSTVGKLAREQRRTVLDIMDMHDELAAACVANATELAQAGIRIVRVTKLEIDVPDEDIKRFDEMRQKVADALTGVQVDEVNIQRAALQAQARAAAAQVDVSTAQYNAQAAQFGIDQQINKDQRYVQMAGGDLRGVGQFEAMRGAGAGLAQGGGNTGLAGLGAQVAVGAALGSNLAGGMVGGGAAPAGGVGMIAGVPAGGAAGLMACPHCGAQVPPGKFCAECGGNIQVAAKRACSGCGAELSPTARFCAECGTPAAGPQTSQQR
ncbi:MAG: SPFH domain-containing protein [Polyangiales bacterium]